MTPLGAAGRTSPLISAVVLTLNEEVNVERCLRSLAWTHEIVVIDSGSSDTTTQIAQGLGATVLHHRQTRAFRISEQRNWALDHANLQGEWVLFLDADEEITPALSREILRQCNSAGPPYAYQLAPKYLFWGRWMRRSMRYPAWHDRLLRRGSATFEGGVWEHFAPGTPTGRIREPYLHYGNSKGFDDWLTRHIRYSSWDAQAITEYLSTRDRGAFGTLRRTRERRLAATFWTLRPLARFFTMYILRGGFLDGPEALLFCLRYALYEYMTVEKIVEHRRRHAGKSL